MMMMMMMMITMVMIMIIFDSCLPPAHRALPPLARRRTARGMACQRWSAMKPHPSHFLPTQFAHRGVGDHNQCRAPGDYSYCAWCYTMEAGTEWDCCDIGMPSEHCVWPPSPPPPQPQPRQPPPSPSPRPPPPTPHPPSPPIRLVDAECYTHFQAFDYRGRKNTTSRGFDCQQWSAQTPHAHRYDPRRYAAAGVGEHNFCRAIGSFCAWCFTEHQGKPEWDCCDIGTPSDRCEILGLGAEALPPLVPTATYLPTGLAGAVALAIAPLAVAAAVLVVRARQRPRAGTLVLL